MSRFNSIVLTLISILSCSIAFAQEQTTTTTTTTTSPNGTVVERRQITTTIPAPKEIIETPAGFASCFMVKSGWYQDVWVAEHNVCTYPNSPNGLIWIGGYWTCDKYNEAEGQCTNWNWKSAHWEKTVSVY